VQYPEIVECHMVSGGFDFLIKLRSAGMEEFRRIAGQVLWQLPGVKETRSYPVMQVVKDSSKIKIKIKINKGARKPLYLFQKLFHFFIDFICLFKATSHIALGALPISSPQQC
jgi:Lrp/AsnC family leucine-responsive transcriptional regulator